MGSFEGWFARAAVVALAAASSPSPAQLAVPTGDWGVEVDEVVESTLASSGAPSISVAVVVGGKIVYEKASGSARLEPRKAASVSTRYAIGSISKQFTSTAVLLLAEDGRLSLDDKVSRWFPQLPRANEVSIRQLLNMTAGYQDYWPQDYVFPDMRQGITSECMLKRWGRLDFDPGTKWEYSNTNYVIAGLIVEKVSEVPLFELLRRRVFQPLGMVSVVDFDAGPLGADDAAGYLRNALGPLRPAPKEGPGWLYAAGGLAMTAHDLAIWNISMMDQTLLRATSYRELQSGGILRNGLAFRYGLGVGVRLADGRRLVAHDGAVSGYGTASRVYPDERVAVAVITNVSPGSGGLESKLADRIAAIAFERADTAKAKARDHARRVLAGLQAGQIDRHLFSPNANDYFSEQVLADFRASFADLGQPTGFVQTESAWRGGMDFRSYRVSYAKRTMAVTVRTLPDGRIEQFQIDQAD